MHPVCHLVTRFRAGIGRGETQRVTFRYSIFGMGVDRIHDLRVGFFIKKTRLYNSWRVHRNPENALVPHHQHLEAGVLRSNLQRTDAVSGRVGQVSDLENGKQVDLTC